MAFVILYFLLPLNSKPGYFSRQRLICFYAEKGLYLLIFNRTT